MRRITLDNFEYSIEGKIVGVITSDKTNYNLILASPDKFKRSKK